MAKPEEVFAALLYLASSRGDFTTGLVLPWTGARCSRDRETNVIPAQAGMTT